MFKNYLLLTFRNISRHKISSLIAILGLSMGLISALLLYTYIDYHYSYEDFLPDDYNVKRLLSQRVNLFGEVEYSGSHSVNKYVTDLIGENVSSIEGIASMTSHKLIPFIISNDKFLINATYTSENFFNIIPFTFSRYSEDVSFREPGSVIIDEIFAEKHYPGENPVGKKLYFNHNFETMLTVTGVVEIPRNSHLHLKDGQVFLSYKVLEQDVPDDYYDIHSSWRRAVYFSPVPGLNSEILEAELENILKLVPEDENYKSEILSYEDFQTIHLFSKENSSDIENPLYMIFFLSLLAIILLAISIFNSVSILTAQSINRTREVGIRVVMGSTKRDLRLQFLMESTVLSFISLIIAIVCAELLLPAFSNLVAIELHFNFSLSLIFYAFLMTFSVGIITGLYPSFYLSSLQAVDSLKGKNLLKLGKSKKILIAVQFFFTMIILIWSLTVNNEIDFIQRLDVGFQIDNIISVIPGYDLFLESEEKLELLRDKLLDIDGIEKISYTGCVPYLGGIFNTSLYKSHDEGVSHREQYAYIDREYAEILELEILEGKLENKGIMVMESVRDYRDLEIGDLIELDSEYRPVSTIIKDYRIASPLYGELPKFHIIAPDEFYFQLIKTDGPVDIKRIKQIWNSVFPDRVVEITTMSANIEEGNYPDIVITLKKVITLTMIVTLFVTALGIFGFILHLVKEKTKEIGIRKVLGAGYSDIVGQFIRETLLMIIAAIAAGIPIGIISIKKVVFLMGYPLPVHNTLKISLLSASALLLTALGLILIMIYQSARSNPASALRYE